MKKRFKFIMFLLLFMISIIGLTSCSSNVKEKASIRTGNGLIEDSNYFESIVCTNDDVEYKTVAKKKVSYQALSDYDSVSLMDGEYLITYEVTTNLETTTMILEVYFDNTKEKIVENFVGVPMTNYNDEEDILFTVDDSHIFLSELNSLNEQEQCSWFGNILHKALNVGMIALSYIEPAIKILVYTSENVLALLYTTVKNTSYLINYGINSNKTQPTGYVYGQNSYSNWNFGFSNMAYAGCEVIAGYNLAHAKGRNYTLADTIFLYESLGIEIGIAQGFFGSNPYQISYFLNATGISYNKVTSYKTFEKYMNNSTDYYVILSAWNGEGKGDMVHTYMIDKDSSFSNKYHAYNYDCWRTSNTTDTNNYLDYIGGKISNTFMCAYFVLK
ncbi:MAG: hypothetical protein K6G28_00075 [Acholeplasmatales bacterium]|nr:hypothetical protein [Acholeplasmatales bacterium]